MRSGIQSQRGLSLVMVMVAVGIVGIVAVGISRVLSTSFEGQASIELRTERVALARTLIGLVNCSNSFSNTTCPSSTLLNVLDKDGKVIISNRGTRYGKWTARAECNENNNGIIVKVALLKNGKTVLSTDEKDFAKDPLTKKTQSFQSNTALLYPKNTNLCPDGTNSAINDGSSGGGGSPTFSYCGRYDSSCNGKQLVICLVNTTVTRQCARKTGGSCSFKSHAGWVASYSDDDNEKACDKGILALTPP